MIQFVTVMLFSFVVVLNTTDLSRCTNYTFENVHVACCPNKAFILVDGGIVGTLDKEESLCPSAEGTSTPVIAIIITLCIVIILVLAMVGVIIYFRTRIGVAIRNYWARLYTDVEGVPIEQVSLPQIIARFCAGTYKDQPEEISIVIQNTSTARQNLLTDTLSSIVSLPLDDRCSTQGTLESVAEVEME